MEYEQNEGMHGLTPSTSTDTSATLPANQTLVNGTTTFNDFAFGSPGLYLYNITASDLTDTNKTASTSPLMRVDQ